MVMSGRKKNAGGREEKMLITGTLRRTLGEGGQSKVVTLPSRDGKGRSLGGQNQVQHECKRLGAPIDISNKRTDETGTGGKDYRERNSILEKAPL